MTEHKRYRLITLLLVSFAIFLVACVPYLYILKFSFTGIDSIPTIVAARIDSISQIGDVFSRELRGGVADSPISYYRPLTLASYSLDYLVWGWDARGYHITDLLLHGMAAIAVFWMTLIAFERKLWESVLVSLLFVLHPATIEVVPAISRRQEPLFMIGCALALLGAHGLPRMRSWLLALLGTIISITSVERGLIIPGVIFTYLLFFRDGLIEGDNPPIKDRLISTIKYSIPFGFMAVVFYGVRFLLFQDTGLSFYWSSLITIPLDYLISIFYPQEFIPLRAPDSVAFRVLFTFAGILIIVVILLLFWKSINKKLYLSLSIWIILFTSIIAVAGQNLSWYTYTIVVPASIILVTVLSEGISRLRQSGGRNPLGYIYIFLPIFIILVILIASPTFRNYHAWQVASKQTQTIITDSINIIKNVPEDTGIVFINIPSHYKENNSRFLVTRSAAIMWPYSLQSWLDVQNVKNNVVVLGSSFHAGQLRTPEIELIDANSLKIYFKSPDSVYSSSEFDWPPQNFGNDKFLVYIYDGTHFEENKELEINK